MAKQKEVFPFQPNQENVLLEYIIKCTQLYHGLSVREMLELAYQFACEINVACPVKWNDSKMADRIWFLGFMDRHKSKLSLRMPEEIRSNRAKSFCEENVEIFFRNYAQHFDRTGFKHENIWNMDAIGFSTAPSKIGKIISLKSVKEVAQIMSQVNYFF